MPSWPVVSELGPLMSATGAVLLTCTKSWSELPPPSWSNRLSEPCSPHCDAHHRWPRSKPNAASLIRHTVTGRHPLLRLIGRDNLDLVQLWIDDWTPIVAEWLRAGLSPFIFTHTPNDFFAAEFAQRFHRRLSELVPTLPSHPKPPAELHTQKHPKPQQLF